MWKANPEVLLWRNPSFHNSNRLVIITIILATMRQRFFVSVSQLHHDIIKSLAQSAKLTTTSTRSARVDRRGTTKSARESAEA